MQNTQASTENEERESAHTSEECHADPRDLLFFAWAVGVVDRIASKKETPNLPLSV